MKPPSFILPATPNIHVPPFSLPSATLRLVSERDGKILFDHSQPARSYTRNFFNFLLLAPFGSSTSDSNWGAGHANFKGVDGAVHGFSYLNYSWLVNNTGTNSTYGIVAGRGTTAESFDSVSLATICSHGTGANQLSYRASSAHSLAWNSGTKTFDITQSRLLDNLSGSTISVTETGIYANSYSGTYNYMFCRDLLSSSVDVLNNGTLTITYVFSLVFPE